MILMPGIEPYCTNLTAPEDPILARLSRETHLKVLQPRMLSGRWQGAWLSMLSFMIKPQRILEIGTYTGYSTICLAKGLESGGLITTIEINDELAPFHEKYFQEAGMSECIEVLYGDARNVLPKLSGTFCMAFVDADKRSYQTYVELLLDKLKINGYIVADNVLWDGKILEASENVDKDTSAIQTFNQWVSEHPALESVILPIRDGLTIARKIR